jgi:hypothetical protein
MDKERSGERMKLGAFFHPTGNHVAAWLHPDAQIDAGTNFRHYAEIAPRSLLSYWRSFTRGLPLGDMEGGYGALQYAGNDIMDSWF